MAERHLAAVTTTPATTTDDGAALDEHYPDKFLDCRTIQHDWRRIGFYHAYGEVVRVLHCARCGCDRHDHWSRSGFRLRAATYDYPEGYKIGGGGASLQELRSESLHRTTVYNSAEALNEAIFGGKRKAKGAG